MAKFVADEVLDAALDVIAQANLMVALPSQPADYADAQAEKLAEVAMASGDYTKSDGAVSGRRLTVAAKSGLTGLANGSATHVALLDTAGSRLLYGTTNTAQAVAIGDTVDIASWTVEIGDPA